MERETEPCNFVYPGALLYSDVNTDIVIIFSQQYGRFWAKYLKPAVKKVPFLYPTLMLLKGKKAEEDPVQGSSAPRIPGGPLDLGVGEWVEVRPWEEIRETLDSRQRHKGLLFMSEMRKFCGKRFRVYKKVRKVMMETTSEVRDMKSPTVFLEGAFCDGSDHYGCDRSCYCFWKEAWLRRVSP